MNKELLEALQSKFDEQKELITSEQQDLIDKAIKAVKEEIKSNMPKDQTEAIKDIHETLNALSKGETSTKVKTTKEVVTKNISALKEMKNNRSQGVSMEVKAPATMLRGTHAEEGNLRATIDREITDPLSYKPSIWDTIPKVITNAAIHFYTERYLEDGEAAMTAEGTRKPLRDWKLRMQKVEAKKIAVVEKASKEFLDDIDGVSTYINYDLNSSVEEVAKEQALMGDGTGENITGLYNYAQAFVPGSKKVKFANLFDLFRLVGAQIRIAGGNPTHIALNPSDAVDLDLQKDESGQYLLPPFTTAQGLVIKGMRVIEDVNMPLGEYVAYDNTKCEIRIRENIFVDWGYENDDFTKNLVTALAEMRLYLIVKENHKDAFVKGVLTDDLAAITEEAPVEEGN